MCHSEWNAQMYESDAAEQTRANVMKILHFLTFPLSAATP